MSGKTGKDWKLGLGTGSYMGGKILNAEPSYEADSYSEPGTGQRQLATLPQIASALPRLRWEQNIQRLADFINVNAIVTAEGDIPAITIYTTDGQTARDLTSAKVNTCEIRITRGQSIRAIIEALGKTWGITAYQTDSSRSEDPIDWTKATLTVGGSGISNWREIMFRANNNVQAEFLGTTKTPTELFERHAEYNGSLERSITATDYFADVASGTKRNVVIAIVDNQTVPVTKTYTFTNALLKVSRKPVRELNLILERVEWECGSLTITTT